MAVVAECYFRFNDTTYEETNSSLPYTPCGYTSPTQQTVDCCLPGDYCLDGHFCRSSYSTLSSPFYLAGCTSPDYTDCNTHCLYNGVANINYNVTIQQWFCCDDPGGNPDCTVPKAESVQHTELWGAPAPGSLQTFASLSSVTYKESHLTYMTATPSITAHLVRTVTARETIIQTISPQNNRNSTSGSLSTGVQAGIGIGVALATLAVAAGVVFALLRCRHRKRGGSQPSKHKTESEEALAEMAAFGSQRTLPEKEGDYQCVQLPTQEHPVELPAWDKNNIFEHTELPGSPGGHELPTPLSETFSHKGST